MLNLRVEIYQKMVLPTKLNKWKREKTALRNLAIWANGDISGETIKLNPMPLHIRYITLGTFIKNESNTPFWDFNFTRSS